MDMPELLAAAELHERIRAVLLFPEMVEINDHTDIPTPAAITRHILSAPIHCRTIYLLAGMPSNRSFPLDTRGGAGSERSCQSGS